MYTKLRCGGNLPLCLAFGTGEGLLWYGICMPCSKRLPGVRDAFSEAFGVKNRLLRYGRDIRCQKQPPLVRDASSKARRTADSTDCGQPPAAPDAFSKACRAKNSTYRTGRIFSARNSPRSEVSRHKKRVTSKSIKTFQPPPFFIAPIYKFPCEILFYLRYLLMLFSGTSYAGSTTMLMVAGDEIRLPTILVR